MKELEKTKRISIASTLFILAILIGLLTYKRPKHIYAINTQKTLENITNTDVLVTLEAIKNPNHIIVDVRSPIEFEKGHLANAINIHTPEILNEKNSALFKELKASNKTVLLYGNNPQEANVAFMFLFQLGYDNLKLLAIENSYSQNKLVSQNSEVEKLKTDIRSFIDESVKKSEVKVIPKQIIQPPKKIIPVQKKKKKIPEGGC